MRDLPIKTGLAGLGAAIALFTESYLALMALLVFFEFMDYITGMYVARRKDGWSSEAAINGFFKKLFYFFMVAAAFGLDFMISEVTHIINTDFGYSGVFGIFSICFLLSTELISILENLAKIGIQVPFLTDALKVFRDKIDKKGNGE